MPTPLSYSELCRRAARQPYTFPLQSNRLESITRAPLHYDPETVALQAAGARPIAHQKVLALAESYLQTARQNGSAVEKAYYDSLQAEGLFDKLLRKRPLVFMTESDQYLLRDGQSQGTRAFDAIGTPNEKPPFVLSEYNSYREMAVAALLGVSVPTYFINQGHRTNQGQMAPRGTFEEQGIYTGLVGARFERPGLMEWTHMIVDPQQNTAARGYGPRARGGDWTLPIWAEMYGEGDGKRFFLPDYNTAISDTTDKFAPFDEGLASDQPLFLNTRIFKQRMRLIAEPYLLDANARGKAAGKRAYVIVVGFGLGVWSIPGLKNLQARLLVEAFLDTLVANDLPYVSDLVFSWFPESVQQFSPSSIKGSEIHFNRESPMKPLRGLHAGKLLVASYAWDGNAYPGNEYWLGSLSASGDPAAACCSTIAELQNPDINPMVCGTNVHFYGEPD